MSYRAKKLSTLSSRAQELRGQYTQCASCCRSQMIDRLQEIFEVDCLMVDRSAIRCDRVPTLLLLWSNKKRRQAFACTCNIFQITWISVLRVLVMDRNLLGSILLLILGTILGHFFVSARTLTARLINCKPVLETHWSFCNWHQLFFDEGNSTESRRDTNVHTTAIFIQKIWLLFLSFVA